MMLWLGLKKRELRLIKLMIDLNSLLDILKKKLKMILIHLKYLHKILLGVVLQIMVAMNKRVHLQTQIKLDKLKREWLKEWHRESKN
jgi:hypothetical protein